MYTHTHIHSSLMSYWVLDTLGSILWILWKVQKEMPQEGIVFGCSFVSLFVLWFGRFCEIYMVGSVWHLIDGLIIYLFLGNQIAYWFMLMFNCLISVLDMYGIRTSTSGLTISSICSSRPEFPLYFLLWYAYNFSQQLHWIGFKNNVLIWLYLRKVYQVVLKPKLEEKLLLWEKGYECGHALIFSLVFLYLDEFRLEFMNNNLHHYPEN